MITDQGQRQLLKLVSGKTKLFADIFAVGISDKAMDETAAQLDFGWATCPITASYIDYANSQVVFHGTLGKELAGDIKEIGLISQTEEFVRTGLPNSIVYSFDANEQWLTDADFEITNVASIGPNSIRLTNTAANNYLAKIVSAVNVSRYDTMKLKLTSSDVSKIKVILKNDEVRFSSLEVNLTNGENYIEEDISGFSPTGQFDPRDINEIRIEILTASGTNELNLDAISFFSKENGGLVARTVLANVQYKRQGSSMEIEYAVGL